MPADPAASQRILRTAQEARGHLAARSAEAARVIVSHRWRLVNLAPPKTTGTVLHHGLSQPVFCERRWSRERQDEHSILIPLEAEGDFIFASVRDPFDGAVSLWACSQSPPSFVPASTYPMSFAESVLENQPQAHSFYRLSHSEVLVPLWLDALVRFDHLAEDLVCLSPIAAALQAGEGPEQLPRLNHTSHLS